MAIFDISWTNTFIITGQRSFLAYLELHDILRDADVFTINSASMNAELLKFQGDKYNIAEKPSEKNTSHRKKFEDRFFGGTRLPSLRFSEDCKSYVGMNRLLEVPVSLIESIEIF